VKPKPRLAACTDLRTCEATCLAGETTTCTKAAGHMVDAPLDADAKRLAAVLERACDGGDAGACVEVVRVHRYAPSLSFDPDRARAWIDRACELGDPLGCLTPARGEVEAAPLRDWEKTPPKSPEVKRGIELARKKCDEGHGRSCGVAAAMLQVFPVDGVDPGALMARAQTLMEQSCLKGEKADCEPAAFALAGPRFDESSDRVDRVLSRGCELGDLDACARFAMKLAATDRAKAEVTLRQTCERGGDVACLLVAQADLARANAGQGGASWKVSAMRGVKIARARCELGDEEGCDSLAKALPLVEVASLGFAETLPFLTKVCDRGMPQLCSDLADAVAALPPPRGDQALFSRLKKAACDQGYAIACPDPVALLGAYVPLPATIVDRRASLEWDKSPVEGAASGACPTGFRLPTKKEVETLNAADRTARTFIRATSPPGARLLSSEPSAGKGSQPLVFDVRTGQIDVANGTREIARCVRLVRKGERPARPAFTLRMSGDDLEYTLRDKNDKIVTTATIVRPTEAYLIGPFWDPSKAPGPVDVDVDASVDWNLAARVLRAAMNHGLVPRRVWIEGKR
jgi:hypothetical protein